MFYKISNKKTYRLTHGSVPRGTKCLLVLLLFGIFIIFSFSIYGMKKFYNDSFHNDNGTNHSTTKYYSTIISHVTNLQDKVLHAAGINTESYNTNIQQKLCPLPKLDPFSAEIMSVYNETIMKMNFSCSSNPALGIFKDVAFHVESLNHLIRDVKMPDGVKCCYKKVERVEDEELRIATECHPIINETTEISYPVDLIVVNCTTAKDEIYYIDGFQILHEKPEVEDRVRAYHQKVGLNNSVNEDEHPDQSRMSVIILGMDTTSQMHFERAMPLSKKYLETNLSAVRLMGYNKVADNTLPNIFPLVTGLFWEELQKSCFIKNQTEKKWDISNCTYIWNSFEQYGYRTSYYEDEITIAIFNLHYPNAFKKKPPTDYYWRPYGLLMETYLDFHNFCYGPRLHYPTLLDNILATAELFGNRRYFNFVFSTDLTHDYPEALTWGDKPLLELLRTLHNKNLLNNTAFFLLGDHGYRTHDDVEQAAVENRQPLAYVVLPPWFSAKFPTAYANLQWNAKNSVLSPFDMYKTFFDFMDLPRLNGENFRENVKLGQIEYRKKFPEKGQSIFEISSTGRNCETAGIPYMWCLCHQRLRLSDDSYLAVMLAETAIAAVNRKVKDIADCEKLRVTMIDTATAMIPNEETFYKKPRCRSIITEGNKTFQHVLHEMVKNDINTFQDGNTCDQDIFIEVSFWGQPQDLYFKSTVHLGSSGTFSEPHQVIRGDWYSNKGHCVSKEFQPYCVCKTKKP